MLTDEENCRKYLGTPNDGTYGCNICSMFLTTNRGVKAGDTRGSTDILSKTVPLET